jgi:MFS family permease
MKMVIVINNLTPVPREPSMSKARRLSLFSLLYGSQFLGIGFIYFVMVAVLREQGATFEQVGAVQGLILVWLLKFLWAPLVDRLARRVRHGYRGLLLVLQPAIALATLALAPLDLIGDFGLVVAAGLLIAFLSATQDIAVDALGVRLLEPAERGIGNGIQTAGAYIGWILGGGGSLFVYGLWGWQAGVVLVAALTLIPWPFLFTARGLDASAATARIGLADWASFFRSPAARRWSLTGLPLLLTGIGLGSAIITPMLIDGGWSAERVGTLSAMLGGAVSIAVALVCGALIDRLGQRRAVLAFAALQVLALAAMLPVAAAETPGTAAAVVAVVGLGAGQVGLLTLAQAVAMRLSRPGREGSDFTVQASLFQFWGTGIGAIGLGFAGQIGYAGLIVAGLVLTVAGVPLALKAQGRLTAPVPEPAPVAA